METVADYFGSLVFNDAAMREKLPKDIYKSLRKTVSEGKDIDLNVANSVANAMKTWAIETHVADAKSCCLNPATSTHRQMSDEQLREAGVPAGLIRLSCGLEDAEDLIRDLDQAMEGIA